MTADLIELYHDEKLDQSETLTFTLPTGSAKSYLVAEDHEIAWNGRSFFVAEIEENRDGERTTMSVECPALWNRLADPTYVGSLVLSAVTPAAGLATILAGTGWTAGPATTASSVLFSLEAQDLSRLALLRQWAKVTGRFLGFNTEERSVDLRDARGRDLGLGFRYRRNVRTVRRRRRPPEVTVLYPFGADGLSIAGVNAGLAYVENFTFYTSRGLTISEARAQFTRSKVWSDTSFVREADLLAAAQARLAELAAGSVSYEMKVIDLTELVGIAEPIQPGDVVRVQDPDFPTDVRATVVRLRRYPHEPRRNEVELSFLPNPLDDPFAGASRPSSSAEWRQFVGPTSATFVIRNDGLFTTNRIGLAFREGGRANFHLDLHALAVGNGTLEVEVLEAVSNVVAHRSLSVAYLGGQTVRAQLSWAAEELSGQYDYRVRVKPLGSGGPSPSLGVNLNKDVDFLASFYVMAQGAVQQSPTLANSQRFDFTGVVQTFTVPDGVTELTATVAGARGNAGSSGVLRTPGGSGGVVTGTVGVTPGTIYDVIVGGVTSWPNAGGGDATPSGNNGGGGGGSSHFVAQGGTYDNAVILAGGGGGGGFRYAPLTGFGGMGGLFAGGAGDGAAGGATQFAGGVAGLGTGAAAGTANQGANAGDTTSGFAEPAGGGGGGLFGGGSGGAASGNGAGGGRGGGGGGSGRIAAAVVDLIIQDGANPDPGYVVFSWKTPA